MSIDIDLPRVRSLLEAGAQLVEVLPASEYEEEHLPGAVTIPLAQLDGPRADGLRTGVPVIAYCFDGQ